MDALSMDNLLTSRITRIRFLYNTMTSICAVVASFQTNGYWLLLIVSSTRTLPTTRFAAEVTSDTMEVTWTKFQRSSSTSITTQPPMTMISLWWWLVMLGYIKNTWTYFFCQIQGEFQLGKPGVQAVDLTKIEPTTGTECRVSGWGRLSVRIENTFMYQHNI